MKTKSFVFFITFLFGTLYFCQASLGKDLEKDKSLKYERKARIILENPKAPKPYRAEVPIDLLEGTLHTDFRILDKNNKELPFLVEVANTDERPEAKFLKIYNQSFVDGKQSLELDLEESKVEEVNELELEIKDPNFDHFVTIYGKDKKDENWKEIKSNLKIIASYLPDQKIDFKHTSLKFPDVRYRFIKLQIQLEKNQKPLQITSVKSQLLANSQENQFNLVNLPFKKLEFKKPDNKSSYWIMDTKGKEYFFETINFVFSGDAFSREASLYCSNLSNPQYIDEPFITYINSSTLYRFKDIQNLQMLVSEKNCKYYILEVFQGDNLPVELIKAIGQSRKMYLKFIYESPFELPLQIYAKSSSKEAPNYDIEARIKQDRIQDFEKAEITEILENPKFKKQNKPKDTKFKTLLPYAGAVVLILLVVFYILSLSKKNSLNS